MRPNCQSPNAKLIAIGAAIAFFSGLSCSSSDLAGGGGKDIQGAKKSVSDDGSGDDGARDDGGEDGNLETDGGDGNTKKTRNQATGDDTGGDDTSGSDAPAWVNSSYLTCNWQTLDTKTDATVACSVDQKDNPAPLPASLKWSVLDGNGQPIGTPKMVVDQGDPRKLTIGMPAKSFAGSTLGLADGNDPDKKPLLKAPFNKTLAGLNAGGTLGPCLDTAQDAGPCFKTSGVAITDKVVRAQWFQANDRDCNQFCTSLTKTSVVSPENVRCASGENRPASATNISYAFGTFGGAGATPGAVSSGQYCYAPGQSKDNDDTDRTVGCYCE